MRARIGTSIWLALCAAALLCCGALADLDPYYSGVVDSVTGEPVNSSGDGQAQQVRISESTYYDRDAQSFVYLAGTGVSGVRSNVADGMIVTDKVRISPDEGVEVILYCNGAAVAEPDLSSITEPGSYSVSAKVVDFTQDLFSFTIIPGESNLNGGYVMPEGFYILEATLDGEEAYYERNFISMEEEGLYEVEYVCSETSQHYHLTVTLDHTPPQLTLEGKQDKEGRFRSAVQLHGVEPGSTVALTRDGSDVKYPTDGKFTEAGYYQLQVFDPAGNLAQEQFTILVYLNFTSLMFFALVCLSLFSVIGYIVYKRKKLRIA